MMATGRFISLEGGEGTGKSTQARRLAAALAERGVHAIVTREPGGSEGAEAIRSLLMSGDVARWSPHAEALLFAAARADHVERTIRPALGAGEWVIADRFLDSSRAYQGAAGGIDDAAILALHGFGSKGLLPDRTILLALTEGAGEARANDRDGAANDRFAARDSVFHSSVTRAFAALADAEPERFRTVDASGTEAEVTDRILAALSDLFP